MSTNKHEDSLYRKPIEDLTAEQSMAADILVRTGESRIKHISNREVKHCHIVKPVAVYVTKDGQVKRVILEAEQVVMEQVTVSVKPREENNHGSMDRNNR